MSLDIYFRDVTGEELFWKNITHNLGKMANEAGFYKQLWHPEDTDVVTAQQLAVHIERGIAELKANPDKYKQYSAPNGWGTYEQFIPWLDELLQACNEYPDSVVETSC